MMSDTELQDRLSVDGARPLTVSAHPPDPNGYIGRQPIYNARREIRAYELLYRRGVGETSAVFPDGNRASAEVMLKAFVDIGMARVSPEQPVFINYPEHLLSEEPIIPADRCVIEVLENVVPNEQALANLAQLKARGYRIALDDFEYREELIPFLELADFVKVDIRLASKSDVRRYPDLLRKFGVILLAEKVESEQEFQECKDLGFELFQGYYLRKPELIGGRRIPSNRLSVMALVAKCTDPKTSAAQVAEVTSRDPTLTYGLLRLANSALYTRRSEIRTPAEAVALLGMDTVFRWTTLLLLAGNDDCPSGYLELALQRARMAELIARSFDCREYDGYIVGLLSTLDSILNVPLAELVEPLPLDSRFKQALVSRQGDLGSLLKTVLAFESLLVESSDRRGLGVDVLQKAFWQAADYAAGMVDSFRATETRY